MNQYTVHFYCRCPVNFVRIGYTLIVTHTSVIPVEDLLEFVESTARMGPEFHEGLANKIAQRFPGTQIMRAHHHGVDIETTREGKGHEYR